MKINKTLLKVIVFSLLLLVAGMFLLIKCQQKEESSILKISASAGLQNVLEELKINYIKRYPEVDIQYNFGSAGSLQRQIEQGAAADLFISASAMHMDSLISKGLVLTDTKVNLLKNKIVLIVPKDNLATNSFEDLLSISKIGIGDPGSTSIGIYGTETMNYYNIFDAVKGKLVFAKTVREVLSWVETQNTGAGFVYETDAKAGKNVRIAAIAPEESHRPIIYPAAILKNNENKKGAEHFLLFLKDDSEAKEIFIKYGFTKI